MYNPYNMRGWFTTAVGTYPAAVKPYDNRAFGYWVRSFAQRAMSNFDVSVPQEFSGVRKYELLELLIMRGYVAVFRTNRFGLVYSPCNLSGYDFYKNPTKAIVANPALKQSLELSIGKDTELLMLSPDYEGIADIIFYFAEKMAGLDNAVNMSIINNKYAFLLGAKTKGAAMALKKVLDKINRGEPAVIVDQKVVDDVTTKGTPFQLWDRPNLKNSYITSQQLEDMQTIIQQFDCEIGIKGLPYHKKERMVEAEANSTAEDSMSRFSLWLECLNTTASQVNNMFGTDISFTMRKKEGEYNGI